MRRPSRLVRALAGWCCIGILAGAVAVPATLAQTQDPVLEFLQAAAAVDGRQVVIDGDRVSVVDPAGDQTNPAGQPPIVAVPQNDILVEEHATLGGLAGDLLGVAFACDTGPEHICSSFGSEPGAFDQGGMFLYQGLAGDPQERDPARVYEWAILGRDPDFPPPDADPDEPNSVFAGAVTHVWLVRIQGDAVELSLSIITNGQFETYRTHARAALVESGIIWLIPIDQEWGQITEYDVYAFVGDATGTGFDSLRPPPASAGSMIPYTSGPIITFADEPAPTPSPTPPPTPSPEPTPASTATPAPTPTSTVTATPAPDGTPASGSGEVPWIAVIAVGLVLGAIAIWLLVGRRRPPPAGTTPPPAGTPPVGPAAPPPPAGPAAPPPVAPPSPDRAPPSTGEAPPVTAPPPAVPPPAAPCQDGDEEWRDDAPPGDFLVADPQGKVQIAIDPPAPTLDAWLDGFGLPRGAPVDAFARIDADELDRLLGGLPTTPSRIEGSIVIPLLLLELQCQRRWICEDGTWVPTADRRLVEEPPSPIPRTFRLDGPDRTIDDVRRTWRQAAEALVAAEAQAADADRYRAACG